MNGTIDIECGNTTYNATRQKDVVFLNTTHVEEVRMAV
jgi:glutamate/aspartate transport system substrate-binding protein